MTSFRQIETNRRNARKSTGPNTEEGKRRSRCNAVSHGLTAETVIGALEDAEYIHKLAQAGFDGIDVEPTRAYNVEDARQFLSGEGIDVDAIAPQVEGKFMSAFIRAVKPSGKDCCGPSCCR